MEMKPTISQRIKILRDDRHLSQSEFGKAGRVTQTHISDAEKGKKSLSDAVMDLICIRCGANFEWLKHGKGQMNSDDKEPPLLKMARRVLESNTHYAESLAANIKSFSRGLDSEQNVKHCEVAPEANLKSIRANDPIEKKDELLKLRPV
jgi:transcriptional regulator with XRE-family HTH domain